MTVLVLATVLAGQQPDNAEPAVHPVSGFVSAARYSGADWLARVNAAAAALHEGGTIEVPDSIAGPATTIGAIPSNVTLEFTGSATFGFCQINVGRFSKIFNNDALLRIDGPDCSGIHQPNDAPLQNSDKFILDGVRVDCAKQANSTGISVGAGHAQTSMRNVTIVNCTNAGMRLDGVQFGEFNNVSLYNNFVGLKIYSDPKGGGGNSNTFYGLKAVGGTVGVIIAANSKLGMGADYFVNPSLLENSTAAMAVFGETWPTDVHWYGGAPEHTAEKNAQAEVTIDGRLVKQSSIYSNLAQITLAEVSIAEARVNPFIRAENSSTIILRDVGGYGNSQGKLVSADASSSTILQGYLGVIGMIENVVHYPAVLRGGSVRMFGVPLASANTLVPNAYGRNSSAPVIADTNGARSAGIASDELMGPVTAVVHAARPGSQEQNRANFGNVVSQPTRSKSDILVSVLLRSSVDSSYVVGAYGDGSSFIETRLQAGRWTRVVIFKSNVPAGTGLTLVGWPADSTGPTVSFSRLEVLAEPSGSWDSPGYLGTVLTTGAVNPNTSPRR